MILLLMLLELLLALCSAVPCSFDGSWTFYGKHCYYVAPFNDLQNFGEASQQCQGRGAYLLSMENAQESYFAFYRLIDCRINNTCVLVNANDQYWIGLERIPGISSLNRWKWQSNSPVVWQNWYPGNPHKNTSHVRMNYLGQWTEASYGSGARYICERPGTPATAEIITTTSPKITTKTTTRARDLWSSPTSKTSSLSTMSDRPTTSLSPPTDKSDRIFATITPDNATNPTYMTTSSVENVTNIVGLDNSDFFMNKVIGVAFGLVGLSLLVFLFICFQCGRVRKKPTDPGDKTNKGPPIGEAQPEMLKQGDAANDDFPPEGQTPIMGERAYDSVHPRELPDLDTEVKYATVSKYKTKSSTVGDMAQGGDIARLTTISECSNEQPLEGNQGDANDETELVENHAYGTL